VTKTKQTTNQCLVRHVRFPPLLSANGLDPLLFSSIRLTNSDLFFLFFLFFPLFTEQVLSFSLRGFARPLTYTCDVPQASHLWSRFGSPVHSTYGRLDSNQPQPTATSSFAVNETHAGFFIHSFLARNATHFRKCVFISFQGNRLAPNGAPAAFNQGRALSADLLATSVHVCIDTIGLRKS